MNGNMPPAPHRAEGEDRTGATSPPEGGSPLAGCALLALLCVAVYGRTLGHGFINYDDDLYVYANAAVRDGLSLASLKWAFTARALSNWHPLTWISHMADVSIFGLAPAGHHALNLLLHGANAILLFLLLRKATGEGGRALFAAALFAVHPLHVESVAWISERKDLLSTLFWFLAAGAWLRHVRAPSPGRYLLVALLFALALLAKPMPVTFPLTLLLLDGWPLRRHLSVPPIRRVTEKIPLFALSAVSAVVAWRVQYEGGSVSPLDEIPFGARVCNAFLSYGAYLGKTLLPRHLSFFYPHAGSGVSLPLALLSLVALVAITIVLFRLRRDRPWLLWGWGWYLVTLVPVVGLVQVGAQSMADRYTYVPLVGIFVALSWEGSATLRTLLGRERGRTASVAVAATLTALLALLSFERAGAWKDGETLYTEALVADPSNYLAHNNLGSILLERGDTEGALAHYLESVRARPNHPRSNFNVGILLVKLGRVDEAIPFFLTSRASDPRSVRTLLALGNARATRGEWPLAAEAYREALAADPANVDARINLGNVVLEMGDREGAVGWYREALALSPGHPGATGNLLRVLAPGRQGNGAGR